MTACIQLQIQTSSLLNLIYCFVRNLFMLIKITGNDAAKFFLIGVFISLFKIFNDVIKNMYSKNPNGL